MPTEFSPVVPKSGAAKSAPQISGALSVTMPLRKPQAKTAVKPPLGLELAKKQLGFGPQAPQLPAEFEYLLGIEGRLHRVAVA